MIKPATQTTYQLTRIVITSTRRSRKPNHTPPPPWSLSPTENPHEPTINRAHHIMLQKEIIPRHSIHHTCQKICTINPPHTTKTGGERGEPGIPMIKAISGPVGARYPTHTGSVSALANTTAAVLHSPPPNFSPLLGSWWCETAAVFAKVAPLQLVNSNVLYYTSRHTSEYTVIRTAPEARHNEQV